MKKLNKFLALTLSSMSILSTNIAYMPLVSYAQREAKDYSIDGLYWEDGDVQILAGWDEAEDKTAYKVKLFRNNKGITSYLTTNSTSYDFTSAIIEHGTGNYTFYAYPQKLGQESKKVSETLKIDSEMLSDLKKNNPSIVSAINTKKRNQNNKNNTTNKNNNTGTSSGASTGLNGGPGTSNKFNSTTSNTFNNSSNKGPGASTNITNPKTPASPGVWQLENNVWYFIDDATKQKASNDWRFINNNWYFFNLDSSMKTGWLEWKGLWYYFNNDGSMLTNSTTPDGYVVDANGVWIK